MKSAADNLTVSSEAELSVIAPIGIANREVVLYTTDACITSLNFYYEVTVMSGYRSSEIASTDVPVLAPVFLITDIPIPIPYPIALILTIILARLGGRVPEPVPFSHVALFHLW